MIATKRRARRGMIESRARRVAARAAVAVEAMEGRILLDGSGLVGFRHGHPIVSLGTVPVVSPRPVFNVLPFVQQNLIHTRELVAQNLTVTRQQQVTALVPET